MQNQAESGKETSAPTADVSSLLSVSTIAAHEERNAMTLDVGVHLFIPFGQKKS